MFIDNVQSILYHALYTFILYNNRNLLGIICDQTMS